MTIMRGCVLLLVACVIATCLAKKHHMELKGDSRRYFPISTFGFYRNGYLSVEVSKFRIRPTPGRDELFGFSLEKTANPYMDNKPEHCELKHLQLHDALKQRVLFTFNTTAMKVTIRCSENMEDLHIYEDMREVIKKIRQLYSLNGLSDQELMKNHWRPASSSSSSSASSTSKSSPALLDPIINRSKRELLTPVAADNASLGGGDTGDQAAEADTAHTDDEVTTADSRAVIVPRVKCNNVQLNITLKDDYYNFFFVVYVANEKEEGLYNLNFHNCRNYDFDLPRSSIDMTLMVTEVNPDYNYLSAGEMPLPALYFMMALLFMLSAVFWFFILRKSKQPVFKIHYLMGVLVVMKSLSLLFHAINYHFIQIQGTHMEAWAVMYYIMHLLKGALLFTVLALIGSGWAFIKHILSSKEKKIFMLVVPLQIIANVGTIIIEETDEWDPEQAVWARLLYLLDFLCCAAILLPVVWSIRHLQEASHTDGKAAMNLSKLKLFRHFYIMVVCYIYFTRIIVYLLRITVPFQYEWLDDMFREMATYVFFVITGYKFRPANSNPYFLIAARGEEDDDEDEDVILTMTSLNENVSRVNQDVITSKKCVTINGGTRTKMVMHDSSDSLQEVVCQDDSELNLLVPTKEDSHDLD
uniref:Protein GPR107-like n=1 Tax=Hirondellea gigas TaxID=1518452 RepID=A0A2P2HZ52_9CRUS